MCGLILTTRDAKSIGVIDIGSAARNWWGRATYWYAKGKIVTIIF